MLLNILILFCVVVFSCVLLNKISGRLGIPVLLFFILLGVLFGSDGILKIPFEDYSMAENICSAALIFIMFYGGFGTSWKQARSTAPEAIILSTAGVVLTAVLVAFFCCFFLHMSFGMGLLLGSIISSTDAASVFSILRSRQLNLRYNSASLLELESGSNDPAAYMMTLISILVLEGNVTADQILQMVLLQVGVGLACGAAIAAIARWCLRSFDFHEGSFDMIFMLGVAVLAYALPTALQGNGYLSTYLCGILLGNTRFSGKKNIVQFFNGFTSLMQMLIFFLLGLLSLPHRLPGIAATSVWVALFLTFVARPAAVFLLMLPFRKPLRQLLLLSFSGLRGAAAIVFAMMAMSRVEIGDTIFHITFLIAVLSVLFQGSLLPICARKLDMIDDSDDVMKSFTDYTEEVPVQFIQIQVPEGHIWEGKTLREVALPPDLLVILVVRGREKLVPNGNTVLQPGDLLILSAVISGEISDVQLSEMTATVRNGFAGKLISQLELPKDELVILMKRGKNVLIPRGSDEVLPGDVLVMNRVQGK